MADKKKIPEITDIELVPEGESPLEVSVGTSASEIADDSYLGTHHPRGGRTEGEDPAIGKVLKGTYKIVKKIGEGGMGNVYKAIQSPLNREVAIKLLKPNENNPEGEHYFLREVQAINMLRHPNIIGIVDFGKDEENSLFLVMEYLPGDTLKNAIRKEFPLDPVRICNICIQVLSALEQAHNTDIVHCDLKPANIMLEKVAGEDDFAKVLDFGIAKVKGPAMEVGPYTQAGNIVGTFDYMSPEQIMRKDLDGRADVWSMGVILYEMLARKRIFHDKDAVSIIGRVMQMPIKRPSEVLDDKRRWNIPPVLEDIALRAMERNIDKRFASAAKMRDALKRARRQLETGWDASTGTMRPVLDDSGVTGVSGDSGGSNSLSGSGLVSRDRSSSYAPGTFGPNETNRTGAFNTRSGGFGMGDSQRLATGIAAGTSVLDQTFSIEELQSSLTGERRKVAVLAIQQRARGARGIDPEDLARRSAREVKIIRDIVEHYDGKIDSFLGGTYTILFGAERARVGDYMRCIECALALQERFRSLDAGAQHLGIGLSYGEIYMSDRKGGAAFGGALDRSVEIARSASDARIIVDETLIELTKARVQFDVQKRVGGELAAEVIQIRADAAPDADEQAEIEGVQVYVPRPVFYDELMRRAADAKENRGGGVGIVGELGTGKSVLLDRFLSDLGEDAWSSFLVRGGDAQERQSLGAVRALIRRIASTYKDPGTLIRKACESIGLSEGLDAVVNLYLAQSFAGGQLPWQDAESFVYFTSSLFHRMIRFAMKRGPVLLGIDDIDVEDRAQLSIFETLLETVQSQPVLVVVARRVDSGAHDHLLPGNFEVLTLGGFSEPQTKQFVAQSLGYTPPIDVVDHLHRKSGGNPMFLHEMVRAIKKEGDSTQVLTAEALEAKIPLSLHELLAQRVDMLGEGQRDLLAVASVLGESFREEFFAQIAPAHLGPAIVLPELIRMGFLSANFDGFDRVHIGFTPRALRRVVYDRLPKETRQRFHGRVVEFLEQAPELAATDPLDWSMGLAFHYRSVEGWEGAAHYLGKAGDVLLDMYDYPAAIAQYEMGRGMMSEHGYDVSNRTFASVTTRLLVALRESGRVDDAVTLVEELGDMSLIPGELHPTLLLERGRLGINAADPGNAISSLERVRDMALQSRNIKLEIQALLSLAEIFAAQNQLTHAGSLLIEVSQKVDQLHGLNLDDPEDRKLYWTAYNQLGTLLIRQRDLPKARNYLNVALGRAREIADSRGLIRILANLGALALSTRDVATAKEYFGQSLQFARATGDLLSQAKILTNLGVALMEANDYDGSKKYFKQARTTAEEIGWHEGLADLSLHIQRLRQAIGGA